MTTRTWDRGLFRAPNVTLPPPRVRIFFFFDFDPSTPMAEFQLWKVGPYFSPAPHSHCNFFSPTFSLLDVLLSITYEISKGQAGADSHPPCLRFLNSSKAATHPQPRNRFLPLWVGPYPGGCGVRVTVWPGVPVPVLLNHIPGVFPAHLFYDNFVVA